MRAVVHIAEDTGSRGGTYWLLTLECGHRAIRHRRAPRIEDVLFGCAIVDMKKKPRRPKYTAPERVRCLYCGDMKQITLEREWVPWGSDGFAVPAPPGLGTHLAIVFPSTSAEMAGKWAYQARESALYYADSKTEAQILVERRLAELGF